MHIETCGTCHIHSLLLSLRISFSSLCCVSLSLPVIVCAVIKFWFCYQKNKHVNSEENNISLQYSWISGISFVPESTFLVKIIFKRVIKGTNANPTAARFEPDVDRIHMRLASSLRPVSPNIGISAVDQRFYNFLTEFAASLSSLKRTFERIFA